MNAKKVNYVNAMIQISISLWMFFDAINGEIYLLFPMFFGIVMMSLNNQIKFYSRGKYIAGIVINLVLLLFLAKVIYDNSILYITESFKYYIILSISALFSMIMFIRAIVFKPKSDIL